MCKIPSMGLSAGSRKAKRKSKPSKSKVRKPRRGQPGDRMPLAFQEMFREQRRKRKISQTEVGLKVGISQKHVSLIEKGKITPRYDTLRRLLQAVGLDLAIIPYRHRGRNRKVC